MLNSNTLTKTIKEKTGKRILLVDDEPDTTLAISIVLETDDFKVDSFNDPVLALSSFRSRYYDLVILDIKMPKMNGFELYTEIRKIDNQVKVCFITAGEMYYEGIRSERQEEQIGRVGRVGREKEEQYCKLDTERFLQKPISNVDLVKIIEKIIMLNNSLDIQNA
jgi:CheY-like chemotaxis protein